MYRKATKIVLFGVTGSCLVLGSIKVYDPQLELGPVGAIRFGRCALTATSIAIDYKWNLYNTDSKSEHYDEILSKIHLRSAEKLKRVLCKNGGAFIKVGQHIGGLDYLLPDEYVKTMKQLHNNAPESDVKDLFETVEKDLNCKISDIFEHIENKPIGTASLAQCHKATLKDGTQVAVKIQHPTVKLNSYADIKTMTFLINCLSRIFPEFKFKWLAEETAKNLPIELDFINEAKNIEEVAKLFQDHKFVKIPKVYWKYCSDRVLTMEYCEGFPVNDRINIKNNKINVNKISERLGVIFSEMIFSKGFVHCDPHPGNVLIRPVNNSVNKRSNENDFEVVLLDHGLYQKLSEEFRYNYANMWMAILKTDLPKIESLAKIFNTGEYYGLFVCIVTGRSWAAVNKGIKNTRFSNEESGEIQREASKYLKEISIVLNLVPRELLLLLKTNDLLRGIETWLETRNSSSSFIHMSKCCVKVINTYERQHKINDLKGKSNLQAVKCLYEHLQFHFTSLFKEKYDLLKIFLFEMFLYWTFL